MNSSDRFKESICEQFGFTQLEAQKILDVYLKVKAVKFCKHTGQIELAHGAFWDKAPMDNALLQ